MRWNLATPLILSCLVLGCATQPEDIKTAYVSPLQYRDYSCRQISNEMVRLTRRVGESRASVDERADDDAANMGISMILFWPALFFLKGDGPEAQEYARLKGELETLEKVAIKKDCDVDLNTQRAQHPQQTMIAKRQRHPIQILTSLPKGLKKNGQTKRNGPQGRVLSLAQRATS